MGDITDQCLHSEPREAVSSRYESQGYGRLCIAMVCDFFYPRLGGAEIHIWSLAQCLMRMNYKVIVITHSYGSRRGVRYMTNGLKVYYLPYTVMVDAVIIPTVVGVMFPLFRKILLRERVDILHGHQVTSALIHECFLQAKTMGLKVVYTTHSLFGFADVASIHLNKLLKSTLSNVDHAIAVSHTCRENLVLRTRLDPRIVSAIPNAVDTSKFTPDLNRTAKDGIIYIVIISRLVYRKGTDLIAKAIPIIADADPRIHFIIGGDGNKRLLLEEMREKHRLHDRVELLGAVPHDNVQEILRRGDMFLNCSLTESFCIAILEAASCGLYVVSTKVGGIPEVLPPDMITMCDTDPQSIADAVTSSIPKALRVDRTQFHYRVKNMYNWNDVASLTAEIYEHVMTLPHLSLAERMRRYFGVGPFGGFVACILGAYYFLLHELICVWSPAKSVEPTVSFDRPTYLRLSRDLEIEKSIPKPKTD